MPIAIERYNAAKRGDEEIREWAGMLGKRYEGGGGGYGRLCSLELSSGKNAPTIYYQHGNGDTSYHPMPEVLRAHLQAEIAANFPNLLAGARARYTEALRKCADEAIAEHAALLKAAGLSV